MSPQAGYSGTPLVKKLGYKEGYRVKTTNAPGNYLQLVQPLPDNVLVSSRISKMVDLWHVFTVKQAELHKLLTSHRGVINPHGMIWVSWPKKASGVFSEITEDDIRTVALPMGLVDIKVCAVDNTWSGLKLVIRKELR